MLPFDYNYYLPVGVSADSVISMITPIRKSQCPEFLILLVREWKPDVLVRLLFILITLIAFFFQVKNHMRIMQGLIQTCKLFSGKRICVVIRKSSLIPT
jgi:hypothetical protein